MELSLATLVTFDGPTEIFALLLLAERCQAGGAEAGAVFVFDRQAKSASAIAFFPPQDEAAKPAWMDLAAQSVIAAPFSPVSRLLKGQSASPVVVIPLRNVEESGLEEYACFSMSASQPAAMKYILGVLGESGDIWRTFFVRKQSKTSEDAVSGPVLGILAEINAADKFKEAAMAFCNELANVFDCDRASVGFLEGRYVQIAAVNHAEKVGRKMDLPRLLELVMEECLDQDTEVMYPALPEASAINRAQTELVRRFGSGLVLALPLRKGEELVGAVVLERSETEPPSAHDLMQLRLVADLATPRLTEMKARDKWFGARLADSFRETMIWAVGPRHTLAKVIGLSLSLFIILSLALSITDRVDATFTLRATEKRIVAAPLDGFLEDALVIPGDVIKKDQTILARLETAENTGRMLTKRAEARAYHIESAMAMRERKTADSQIALAKAEQAEAEAGMFQERIARSEIKAPCDGVILTGEWRNKLGSPIKLGDTVFEVAPLDYLEAEVFVPDTHIIDVEIGQRGELAVAGNPNRKFTFTVMELSPAAEIVKQKNVFRVLVRLDDSADWLKPGMEGVAKIEVGKRSPALIWTRPAINWLRLKLWV